jgi:hypothetical protein
LTRADRRAAILPILAATIVALSLFLRAWHRDGLYPGWDILGAAEGLRLVAMKSPAQIFKWLRAYHFDGSRSWNVYGVPLVLVPGWLTWLHPWEHWASVTALVFTAGAFALAAWAVLPPGERWLVLFGLGASGALLSSMLCGFAYGSAFWPYAVALAVVLRGRRFFPSLLGTLGALELAWHVQELGPTVCIVFLLAALGRRGVPLQLRLLWLAAGAGGVYLAVTYPPGIVTTRALVPSLEHLTKTAAEVLAVFRSPLRPDTPVMSPMRPDTPVLLPLALLAVLLVRRDRLLWSGLLAFQLALVAWLALTEGPRFLWPRRLLLLDSIAMLVVVVAATDRPRLKPLLVGALAVANVWQLAETVAWVREPRDPRHTGFTFPLPYTHTNLDYMVAMSTVAWTDEILRDIDAGKQVILLYNFQSYEENATNPTGVPERLYIRLGHRRFMDSVFMFGSFNVRHHEFPLHPLDQLDAVLERIPDPRNVVVHFILHPGDTPDTRAEYARIRAAVERHFVLSPAPGRQPESHGEIWQRGVLGPLPAG